MDIQDNNDIQRETSTASETGGSATEGTVLKDPKLKHAKSAMDTPKTNLGQWNNQKDHSNGDFEIFAPRSKNQSPIKNDESADH